MISIFLALQAALPACAVPADQEARQLRMAYAEFDSAPPPHGWRALNGAGCTDAAVNLLTRYRIRHGAELSPAQHREMSFHLGQVLAFAGRHQQAIPHFEQANAPEADPEWRTYVAATLAFLRGDRTGLAAARDAYARIAPNSMRLRVIEGLLACPDRAYMEASHCRMGN